MGRFRDPYKLRRVSKGLWRLERVEYDARGRIISRRTIAEVKAKNRQAAVKELRKMADLRRHPLISQFLSDLHDLPSEAGQSASFSWEDDVL